MAKHDFENHGLGAPPYTFRGYDERVHRIPGGIGGPDIVKSGSSCDRCGTPLRHCYWFESADGHRFKVGVDCAGRANSALGKVCREARASFDRETRERLTAEAKAKRDQERAAIVESHVAASRRNYPTQWAAAEGLAGTAGFPGSYSADMLARLQDGGTLTERQAHLLANLWREHNWTAAPEGYAGTVGERAEFTLTLLREHEFESQFGGGTIYIFADDDGHRFTLKTASGFSVLAPCYDHARREFYTSDRLITPGDKIRAKATPKAHDLYNGTRQTKIQRLKIVEYLGFDLANAG